MHQFTSLSHTGQNSIYPTISQRLNRPEKDILITYLAVTAVHRTRATYQLYSQSTRGWMDERGNGHAGV